MADNRNKYIVSNKAKQVQKDDKHSKGWLQKFKKMHVISMHIAMERLTAQTL